MENDQTKKEKNQLVFNYLFMRKAIGILGISFPFILIIGSLITGGCNEIQSSISSYYYTKMRDVFVGILCAVALFLFSYKGYDYRDNIAANLGCIFALGVAFFPCGPDYPLPNGCQLTSALHLVSAALFFAVLIFFSLYLFRKSYTVRKERLKKEHFRQKNRRNFVYWFCGIAMLLCILSILVIEIWFEEKRNSHWEFWLESIALVAFGISWLTKGEMIFKDITQDEPSPPDES